MSGHITFTCHSQSSYVHETRCSAGIRITAVVTGILFVLGGILVLHGLLGLNHLNTSDLALCAVSIGTVFTICAALLKYEKQSMRHIRTGSQDECNGSVDHQCSKEYLDTLNQKCATSSVRFAPALLTENIVGGTCSAKCLAFLDSYFSEQAKDPEQFYASHQATFAAASAQDRNIQAALNCITVEQATDASDTTKEKIQACLNLYDIIISEATEIMDLTKPLPSATSTFSHLSDGTYFVRSLLPSTKTIQGERHGHSMVLIRSGSQFYLYEPNSGLYTTSEPKDLHTFFQEQNNMYYIPQLRLYRCQRSQTL